MAEGFNQCVGEANKRLSEAQINYLKFVRANSGKRIIIGSETYDIPMSVLRPIKWVYE